MLFPMLRQVGQNGTACNQSRIDTQFAGADVAALLQFEETAPFRFIGSAATHAEQLRLFFRGKMQATSNCLQQTAAPPLGKILRKERLDGMRVNRSSGDFDKRLVAEDEVRRTIHLDSFRLAPLP